MILEEIFKAHLAERDSASILTSLIYLLLHISIFWMILWFGFRLFPDLWPLTLVLIEIFESHQAPKKFTRQFLKPTCWSIWGLKTGEIYFAQSVSSHSLTESLNNFIKCSLHKFFTDILNCHRHVFLKSVHKYTLNRSFCLSSHHYLKSIYSGCFDHVRFLSFV